MKKSALPEGYRTLEDETIVDLICKDELFKESLEAEFGKIDQIYPDWINDCLVYQFADGEEKCSVLSEIIKVLKGIEYLKTYSH